MTSDTCRCHLPGAAFIVIEAEFVLGGFKAFFDGPAMAFDRYQLFHGHALGAPRRKNARSPSACCGGSEGLASTPRRERCCIGRHRDRPVRDRPSHAGAAPWFLRPPTARRQAFRAKICAIFAAVPPTRCFLPQNGRHGCWPRPGLALACLAQALSMSPMPYTLSAATKRRDFGGDRGDHLAAIWGFVAKPTSSGTCAVFRRSGSSSNLSADKAPIDEGVAVTRHIGGKDADLAVGDLARRARVLACNTARNLALLQKTGLVDERETASSSASVSSA